MKAFFQGRSLRERMLLLVFGLIALGWWAPTALGRLGALRHDVRIFQDDRATQQMWLSHRAAIEAQAAAAARTLDPAKTLSSSQAFSELSKMTGGLAFDIGGQRTASAEQFALHSMVVNIRKADLKSLYGFYEQLSARAPYLGIDKCVISVDRANSGQLSAGFWVYSIEAIRPAK